MRIVFGNWTVLKNHPKYRDEYAKRRLNWIAYIGGKRESRRLLGDVILKQQDITQQKPFVDASVTTTWTIDLHYPEKPACACDAFQSVAKQLRISPYPIPYRCLYSRNIDNLMMAGRNISVTHVALGTVRVQRTTGMMGEVLGMAASLCKKHDCTPREVYQQHLDELKAMMTKGVPKQSAWLRRRQQWHGNDGSEVLRKVCNRPDGGGFDTTTISIGHQFVKVTLTGRDQLVVAGFLERQIGIPEFPFLPEELPAGHVIRNRETFTIPEGSGLPLTPSICKSRNGWDRPLPTRIRLNLSFAN